MNSAEAMARSGATYRQLDYWTRQGLLKPADGSGSGSGSVRQWTREEVEVMERMVPLIEHGLSPQMAAKIARLEPGQHVTLYDNIRILVEE